MRRQKKQAQSRFISLKHSRTHTRAKSKHSDPSLPPTCVIHTGNLSSNGDVKSGNTTHCSSNACQSKRTRANTNAEIEQEKAEYLAIFSRHNLDLLALKKPGMIESRMNGASEKVMEGIENDTEELYKLTVPDTDN